MARKPAVRIAAVVAALAMAATACGGGGDEDESQSGEQGGTLNILRNSDFEHLDPARAYVSDALAFGRRLLTRSLTQ